MLALFKGIDEIHMEICLDGFSLKRTRSALFKKECVRSKFLQSVGSGEGSSKKQAADIEIYSMLKPEMFGDLSTPIAVITGDLGFTKHLLKLRNLGYKILLIYPDRCSIVLKDSVSRILAWSLLFPDPFLADRPRLTWRFPWYKTKFLRENGHYFRYNEEGSLLIGHNDLEGGGEANFTHILSRLKRTKAEG